MKNKKTKIKIDWRYIFYGLLAFICLFANVNFKFSLAEETNIEYTGVLTDLQKDENFSVEDYPFIENDYSLQVIQIAESSDDELFIYVYQPCKEKILTASYVNMSTTALLDANIYELELLNYETTLYKYKVKDFTITDTETRQYDLTSIYRPFEESIDDPAEGDNTITNVVYSVSKTWYATTYNNHVYYQTFDTETIEVTDKYCGYVRYPDGYWLIDVSCDSHFVAFSTDKPIDKLISAKVYYTTQSYTSWPNTGTMIGINPSAYYYECGEKESHQVNVSYTQKAEYTTQGWALHHTYSWNRISTVSDFIENIEGHVVYKQCLFDTYVETTINPSKEENLNNKQWVLRFVDTSYFKNGYNCERTIVGDVSIIQLKFETLGKIYDLGCVDNMQTEGEEPINVNKITIKLRWWLIILLAVGIGLIIAFPSILITLFNVIVNIFKYIFKALWWLITAPLSWLDKEK